MLFTVVLLPEVDKKFPTVVCRTPYVDSTAHETEESIVTNLRNTYSEWLKRGYAVCFQHCRGKGKSTGKFVPYIYEREDGLLFRDWIRKQSFYNGELYLFGGSYTASLHYATAPFEDDIKGAAFEVQDSERYNLWYRNGQMRKGHANWHFSLYNANNGTHKKFSIKSFGELPLKNLSQKALGEPSEDFEQMLEAQKPLNDFWNTRFGGQDARDAVTNANIPLLLTTGYNDFYVGGIFKMWNKMCEDTKNKCALLVSPYNHGDDFFDKNGISFPNGKRKEQFGGTYQIDWFDSIRKKTPLPYKRGVITYYRAFENVWASDFYNKPTKLISLPLGNNAYTFKYNPLYPTAFSAEGTFAKENINDCNFIRVYTQPFGEDKFIKGKMQVKLTVSSDCADTSFYVRISIKNDEYSYVLRHDITSLDYQLGTYTKNDIVSLDFCFDEYAFLLKKYECLQIDIASTDDNTYICHTNKKGDYYLQTDTEIATNTVYLDRSYIFIPVEY